MGKFFIRFFLIALIVIVSLVIFLTYFGLETDKFDGLIKRKANEGDYIYDTLEQENRMSVYLFHHALWHADILFRAIPSLNMIHIKRHPRDILYSWYIRGYGALSYWEHPRSGVLGLRWKDKIVPYYVLGWEEEC